MGTRGTTLRSGSSMRSFIFILKKTALLTVFDRGFPVSLWANAEAGECFSTQSPRKLFPSPLSEDFDEDSTQKKIICCSSEKKNEDPSSSLKTRMKTGKEAGAKSKSSWRIVARRISKICHLEDWPSSWRWQKGSYKKALPWKTERFGSFKGRSEGSLQKKWSLVTCSDSSG